jgi:drug/metabolite transporter (DMT)-like permease
MSSTSNTSTPASTDRRALWTGLTLAAIGAIGFSGKAIVVKLAYRHGVDTVTLVMYRMLLALPLFLALTWWASRGKPPLTRHDWWTVVALGFTGSYLTGLLDFAGLQYISASLERLIIYLTPTLVLLISVLLFKRRATGKQIVALAVSYAGVVLVFGQEATLVGADTALGSALVFGSAVSYAIYIAYGGEVVRRLGALRLTGLATTVASLLCIAQFLALRPMSAAIVTPDLMGLLLINSTLCTFAPVLMMMMGIERLGATLAAQTGMIGPLSTIMLGVIILDEPFTAWVAAGTGLVLLGIWLLAKWR